jgi:O-antigen biosynthesis protein
LGAYYERARIFVAPTRFVAGIPVEAYEAAARGVPIVATVLAATQLGWVNGEELVTAPSDNPESFADQCVRLYIDEGLWSHVRQRALVGIQRDCSPTCFDQSLRKIIASVSGGSRNAVVTSPAAPLFPVSASA